LIKKQSYKFSTRANLKSKSKSQSEIRYQQSWNEENIEPPQKFYDKAIGIYCRSVCTGENLRRNWKSEIRHSDIQEKYEIIAETINGLIYA
jgi:hypothetical protein